MVAVIGSSIMGFTALSLFWVTMRLGRAAVPPKQK